MNHEQAQGLQRVMNDVAKLSTHLGIIKFYLFLIIVQLAVITYVLYGIRGY